MVRQFNAGFDEHGVVVTHHMPDADGVYMKEALIPAGKELTAHEHTFTHKSILASGRAVVRSGGVEALVCGPAVLTIRQGLGHSVRAVTDVVWFCIHASNETDPEMIDHTLVKET